ncbi:hypothetical protein CIB95_00530 [Lottiidibacillus patelloidae]|uniref:Uncharacterized protein n=1 Tax=Lottiidibacillus patelloidae TaxID=2670334 RepID=A0A263BWZ9_9BACI|nr:hypothetical protein [Lottiidibacillus patelloidae]OZM58098.1 hypothetical protein CIB95_00530 [Lottiidibacillus patelloidae]
MDNNLISLFRKIYEPISPKQFDANEWWIIFITSMVVLIIIFLHKKYRKISLSELLFIFLFNIYYASVGDYVLAVKPVDLYDTVDRNSGELFDMPLHIITYPGVLYIFLFYFLVKRPKKTTFVFICAALLTFFEWVSVEFFHLFLYKGWNLFLSFPFYAIVVYLNLAAFLYIHTRLRKEKSPS